MNSQLIVLASSSPYRAELLARLQLPFSTAVPDIDEKPEPGETAQETALRLSILKARAIGLKYPEALVIGSDQVALLDGIQLGKPGSHENASAQLLAMRGKVVSFYTALCLLNAKTGDVQTGIAANHVHFRRDITPAEIDSYLRKDQPYNCAGSAKMESLGIALIQKIEGDDPNALIGLPLILLTGMLKKQLVSVI